MDSKWEPGGSIVRVEDTPGVFMFAGLAKDRALLDGYEYPTWTKYYAIDTATVYIYEKTSGKWYEN